MNILFTAKQRGSANVLAPIARELINRGHEITIYATGNENEAAGFSGLEFKQLSPTDDEYLRLVKGYDTVVIGLSGYHTPDGHFLRAANFAGIPTMAILDQNSNYLARFGSNPDDLPTIIAIMNEDCIQTAKRELSPEMGEEVAERSRVIGWAAFDNYAQKKAEFNEEKQDLLRQRLKLEDRVDFYPSMNVHPNTKAGKESPIPYGQKVMDFLYEQGVTQFTFEAASDLGLKLVIKPHPKEEGTYTKDLCARHSFRYIELGECDTEELMLISDSITAGRSTCLIQGTLFDKNTGGILPGEIGKEWSPASPPIANNAIPFTYEWQGIKVVLEQITSPNFNIRNLLAENRRKFSVDGKASKRAADLIESLGR